MATIPGRERRSQILDEEGITFQRTKTRKESNDPMGSRMRLRRPAGERRHKLKRRATQSTTTGRPATLADALLVHTLAEEAIERRVADGSQVFEPPLPPHTNQKPRNGSSTRTPA